MGGFGFEMSVDVCLRRQLEQEMDLENWNLNLWNGFCPFSSCVSLDSESAIFDMCITSSLPIVKVIFKNIDFWVRNIGCFLKK